MGLASAREKKENIGKNMGVVALLRFVAAILSFMSMVRAKSGRRIKFYYHLAAVKFFGERRTKEFYSLDLVLASVKVFHLLRLLVLFVSVDVVYSARTVFRRFSVSGT